MNAEAPILLAGASFAYALGQFVALKSGHTGHITGLFYDSETGRPTADIALIEPIIIPASKRDPDRYPELSLWRQHEPLNDLCPADENAAIRRQLVNALRGAEAFITGFEDDETQPDVRPLLKQIRAALGSAES